MTSYPRITANHTAEDKDGCKKPHALAPAKLSP
jgi:hypothetical protein